MIVYKNNRTMEINEKPESLKAVEKFGWSKVKPKPKKAK